MVASESIEQSRRPTKNEKRRLKKKEEKRHEKVNEDHTSNHKTSSDLDVEIEYVSADLQDVVSDRSILDEFKSIFEKYAKPEELTAAKSFFVKEEDSKEASQELVAAEAEQQNQQPVKLSKKKKKLLSRLSVAELKQLVPRPDVVEAHDVTSSDPRLLVYLKAYRGTVPVPRHWCHKRKYLAGKRGIDKGPFKLPDFIAETGIAKIRETVLEQEALKKSKQKAREKMQPKMGKIDIDYQVLHDAFFKYQTKPKMSGHGDLYYEGKEFEIQLKECKPGHLSTELMTALGMTPLTPPPWLINMQRYGPPPSYPSMRIPGLSAPIPPGAQFGYHPGGWGKPPVDEYGRPLYGDVFGTAPEEMHVSDSVDKTTKWGEFLVTEAEEEEESEEESEEEGDLDAEQRRKALAKEELSGLETPSTMDGISTVNTGMETPDTVIDLRKRSAAGLETPDSVYGGATKELYTVLSERHSSAAGQLFGSDKTYVVHATGKESAAAATRDSNEQEDKGEEEAEEARKRKRRLEDTSAAKRMRDFKF